jgi:putative exosortase-associated protein (TIGR04073 family)
LILPVAVVTVEADKEGWRLPPAGARAFLAAWPTTPDTEVIVVRRIVALSLLALALNFSAGLAMAAGEADLLIATDEMSVVPSSTKGPYYGQSEGEKRFRKLIRGFANVTLCIAEVPNQAFQQAYRTSPVTGFVIGAWKGFIKGGKRFLVGWWEMFTFYHPTGNQYEPIIQPEVIFQEYRH